MSCIKDFVIEDGVLEQYTGNDTKVTIPDNVKSIGDFAFNGCMRLEDAALDRILDVAEYYRGKSNFANARTVRNILDQVIMNQNLRVEDEDFDDNTIILQDVEDYISDEKIMRENSSDRRIGFY